MGSWITCRCGAPIHTNMFTGTHIYRLIEDSDYDAVEDPVDRDKLEKLFFKKGVAVYHCRTCGRLLVEWDHRVGPTFYLPEDGAALRERATTTQNDEKDGRGPEDPGRGRGEK